MKNFKAYILFSVIFSMLVLNSCFNETFRTDSDTFLEFSLDTLAFDTVFTTLGSATRSIKVYNPYNESVTIEKVYLENAAKDFFRLNIDGLQANMQEQIDIAPRDSIYIFAEVTIDPDQPLSDSPFIIEDHIRFVTNGNDQSVLLSAWGQNANYIPNSKNRGGQALLSCNFGQFVFNDVKPYVIYGVLLVDSCELVFPAGADIYVHGGVVVTETASYNDGLIVILENGRLTSMGTLDDPVTIQGDRLEKEYDDIPGQWGGIIINDLAKGSTLEHTIVKNSVFGIRVDSLANLRLNKCQFYNQTSSGLVGFHADNIVANNCLFHSSGGSAVTLAYGGNYELNYCTMASYDSGGGAIAVSNFRCIEPTCLQGYLFNPVDLKLTNCIMAGDEEDEVIFSDRSIEDGDFTYELDHCIVQVKELLDSPDFANFFDYCNGCLNVTQQDTLFLNLFENNYRLDTMSIAKDKGVYIASIVDDIFDYPRDLNTPDIGCFEFQD